MFDLDPSDIALQLSAANLAGESIQSRTQELLVLVQPMLPRLCLVRFRRY